jgi:hypothetical protein
VAGEGGDRVLQLEEDTGDEGRSMAEGDNGRVWELTEGGNRWLHSRRHRHASGGRPWIGGKGGAGRSGARGVLAKEEEMGEKKGVGGVGNAYYQCDGR